MAYSKKEAAKTSGLQRIKDKKKKPGGTLYLTEVNGKPVKKKPGASTRPKPGGPVKPKPIKRGK